MRENMALIQSLILTLLVTNTTLYIHVCGVEFCVCLLVIILNLCVLLVHAFCLFPNDYWF